MSDAVTADRVRAIASAARIPLDPASAEHIASATTPTAARFATSEVILPLEVEPATFAAVQRREIKR